MGTSLPGRKNALTRDLHGEEVVAPVKGLGANVKEVALGIGFRSADHDQRLGRLLAGAGLAEVSGEDRALKGDLDEL